jgi:hypothetical protein
MHSPIKNEKFILVSESVSFKTFFINVAKGLNVKPPTKEAKPWLLNIAWRLDWLNRKLFSNQRNLTKQAAKSLINTSYHDTSKIKNELNFQFKNLDKTIKDVCSLYLKDLRD